MWALEGGCLNHFLSRGVRKPDFATKQVAGDRDKGVGLTVGPEVSAPGDAPATTRALLPLHRQEKHRTECKEKRKQTKPNA